MFTWNTPPQGAPSLQSLENEKIRVPPGEIWSSNPGCVALAQSGVPLVLSDARTKDTCLTTVVVLNAVRSNWKLVDGSDAMHLPDGDRTLAVRLNCTPLSTTI